MQVATKQLNTRIVLRNDSTANWLTNEDQVLLKGELGIEFLESGTPKIKIGDGVTAWKTLTYFGSDVKEAGVFQATLAEGQTDLEAISAAVGDATLQKGDIAIVKKVISGDKVEYTAYVYDGSAWAAMDGNYNAENVYFDEDLMTTSAIGNITLTNGQATIAANGKNLKEVFQTIFVKESNPTITQPSVAVSLSGAGAKEVGSKVTPTYTAQLNAGSYQYGPATGITASSWEISDTAGNTATTAGGSFAEIQIADATNYKITAKATYDAGAVPKTNIGNEYKAGQIAAGSKSNTSGAFTGYRNTFYGTKTSIDGELNSAYVRGLTPSNGGWAAGKTFTINIPAGAMRVIFAYPATVRDVNSVKDVNGLNAEVKSAFVKSTVSVEGANGYAGIDYKVYVCDFAEAVAAANKYTVTL